MNYSVKNLIKEVLENDIKALKKKYRNIKTIQISNSYGYKINEIIYLQKLEPTRYVLTYNYECKQASFNTNETLYKYLLKEVEFKITDGKNKIIEIQLQNNHTIKKLFK
ncbi:MAG: hypothetical protein ACRCXT_04345 [Paraclostridium sp.]